MILRLKQKVAYALEGKLAQGFRRPTFLSPDGTGTYVSKRDTYPVKIAGNGRFRQPSA